MVKCIFFVDLMIYIGCYEPVALSSTDRFETYITAKVMVEPGGRVPGMVNWIHQRVYIYSHYKGMLHFVCKSEILLISILQLKLAKISLYVHAGNGKPTFALRFNEPVCEIRVIIISPDQVYIFHNCESTWSFSGRNCFDH